jgi:hypothetical protein
MTRVTIDREKRNINEFDLNTHALVSFRAIVAGLLISLLTMLGLIGLGMAIGGIRFSELTSFSRFWLVASIMMSLFFGSYFASRVSRFRKTRIGSVQGLVIASLFLGFLVYQTIMSLGITASAVNSFFGGQASLRGERGVSGANSEVINNLIEDSLGNLNLRLPSQAARGIGPRILSGDRDGAKQFLLLQGNISSHVADDKINQIKARLDQYLAQVNEVTASALRSMGWTLFLVVFFGAISSMGGGALGSKANFKSPLTKSSEDYYPPGQTA